MSYFLALVVFIIFFISLINAKNKTIYEILTTPSLLLNELKQKRNNSLNITCIQFRDVTFLVYNNKKSLLDRYSRSIINTYMNCKNTYERSDLNNIPDTDYQIKSLFDHHSNKRMLAFGNSSFLIETRKIFKNLQNPAFLFWNDGIVVSWRFPRNIIRVAYIKSIFINYTNMDSVLDSLQNIKFKSRNISHIPLHGEDARLITIPSYLNVLNNTNNNNNESDNNNTTNIYNNKINNRLFVIYSMRFARTIPEIWMYYSELILNKTSLITKLMYKKKEKRVNINFNYESKESQKNWSPFLIQELNQTNMLFIQSIVPKHRIVKINPRLLNYIHGII